MGPDQKIQDVDGKENLFSTLLDSVEEYGRTSYKLFTLKTLDKASDLASAVISRITAVIACMTFLFMASLGVAFWLGDVMGRIWYGFFAVAAFYGLVGLVVYFFMHKGLKRIFANMIIHQTLK
jgi:hypothetical protein